MKKTTLGLVAALTPLIACASAQSSQISIAPNLTTLDTAEAIAQSNVTWLSSGFYHLSWLRDEDQSEMSMNAVYIEASSNYRIDVYKTVTQDPFGSVARCGGLGCGLDQGELAGSLQLRPLSNTEFVVESATRSAAFLEGASCSTRMAPVGSSILSCYSSTGPVGNIPSIIQFWPGS